MFSNHDRPVFATITGHWLSLLGAFIVTTASVCWLLALPSQIRGHVSNPYIGILLFVVLPIVFVGGLLLIPVGVYFSRKKVREGFANSTIDRATSIRRLVTFLGVTTFFNIVIASQLTYRAVEHMETTQFCGQSCHVMKPEFTAYQNSVHSRVLCVDCHVAPGASGWVSSKLSGTRQLLAVALNNHPRPIESAMESDRLIPSSQTCEQCHWPEVGGTVRVRVIPNYKSDEQNTASHTVLSMVIGGSDASGIHGSHFGPGIRIRYAAADPKRESIPWVEYRNEKTKTLRTFATAGSKSSEVAKLPAHDMQCVDCHNRPAHAFELPERAVNRAIASGDVPAALPFVKKKSLELLNASYQDDAEAARKIADGLGSYYRTSHPAVFSTNAADVTKASKAIAAIYARNVFPDLKVTWGTYPSNIGHTDSPGCFRCHDDGHASADQKVITQNCTSCHEMLAVEEASPEILKTLNLGDRLGQLQRR
ncbi:MAG: NapC/NirT family cytochrome c [Bryobacteraceae bacterium]|nr:NapC/NirT family cytochrome c [Bryobacteraceae bacterium]